MISHSARDHLRVGTSCRRYIYIYIYIFFSPCSRSEAERELILGYVLYIVVLNFWRVYFSFSTPWNSTVGLF